MLEHLLHARWPVAGVRVIALVIISTRVATEAELHAQSVNTANVHVKTHCDQVDRHQPADWADATSWLEHKLNLLRAEAGPATERLATRM